MKEQALPSPSTAVKYTVSLEDVGDPFATSAAALVGASEVAKCRYYWVQQKFLFQLINFQYSKFTVLIKLEQTTCLGCRVIY